MFISELFPNDLGEAKAKPWCPIEDSAFTEWPEYGKTKDGRKSIKTEVDNGDKYRDEIESHGWFLDHSDPIDPGYPIYVNKNTPGEQIHIIPDGYGIGNYHATVVLVTNQKVVGEVKNRRKKEEPVQWIPVDTVQHPAGTPYSPKNKYLDNPDYNTRNNAKTIDEFAPTPGDSGDDEDELERVLQTYIAVASKINVRNVKVQTALRKIAEIMATKVPVVSDEFVDFAYQVARKRQGMPNLLDNYGIKIDEQSNGYPD